MEARWRDAYGADGGIAFSHDVTEVAPGLVMSASVPMALLDARTDPTRPKVLAVAPDDDYQPSNHNVVWPRSGSDRFIVTASEGTDAGRCEVYDARRAAARYGRRVRRIVRSHRPC